MERKRLSECIYHKIHIVHNDIEYLPVGYNLRISEDRQWINQAVLKDLRANNSIVVADLERVCES